MTEKTLGVTVSTPMGDYPAKLRLEIHSSESESAADSLVEGTLSMMGHDHNFRGGKLSEGIITLAMEPSTPLGTVPFKAKGMFTGDTIDISTRTRLGVFRITNK